VVGGGVVAGGQPGHDHADRGRGGAHGGVEAEVGHVDDHALGGHEAGGHVDDVDAGAGHLVGQDAHDPVQGPLRHGVAETPAPVAGGGGRVGPGHVGGHVEDEARAPLDHLGQEGLDEDQRRQGVGFEVALQQLDGRVEEAVHVAGADVTAVVDQDVDVAPLVQGRGRRRDQRRPVGEVRGHR